ncbi:MAG: 4'-phosphopantetheinyl transferase superfamily protein [Alphaproteobacteria bacterium]|nr:4'-phosphopantetheinyl transferase superfamily protein [Alphaproteobacteria bacterium]
MKAFPPSVAAQIKTGFSSDQICLLHCSPGQLAAERLRSWQALLSAEERGKAVRFRYYSDYAAYICAHALLRAAIAVILDITIDAVEIRPGQNGKPELARAPVAVPLRFNLSHTEDMVLIALTRGIEVGVDVERLDRTVESDFITHCCSPREGREMLLLSARQRVKRFIRLWTLKEALLKASGQGITRKMKEICCNLDPPRLLQPGPLPGNPADWRLWRGHFPPTFVWSLAVRNAPRVDPVLIPAIQA